jgi:hypothetical protein
MGSIFGDNEEGTINLRCRPNPKLGKLDLQTAGSGTVEMIRETLDGTIERFDIAGGKLIDSDGTWSYQVPMNLDYRVTDESGNLVETDDPNKGIPTRARVRFRIGMDNNVSGVSRRAKYLVPHNPRQHANTQLSGTTEFPYGKPAIDFEFGPNTSKASLADLTWNTVYSVKNYIRRYEKSFNPSFAGSRAFIGIKDVDSAGGDINPFPYNSLNIVVDPLFNFICGLVIILATLVATINFFLITPLNGIIGVLNSIIDFFGGDLLAYIPCITLECTSEGDVTVYAPGCLNNSDGCTAAQEDGVVVCVGSQAGINDFDETLPPGDAGYTACVAASLLQSLDLLEFDFFNDWVNGTLYSPLFINRNRTANSAADKDNFCEWSCGGFDGYTVEGVRTDGTTPDNNCRKAMVVKQICGQGVYNQSQYGCTNNPVICESSSIIPNILPISQKGLGGTFIAGTNVDLNGGYGVIVKKENEYYYTPYARVSDDYILATDIITLGSSVSCHWLGLPSIIRFLDDTSYKIPPVIPTKDQDTNGGIITAVSGMDSENENLADSLFFNVNCFYTSTDELQCSNIRRQCELGVGLDQDPPPVDNTLDDDDLDIRIGRNLFAWMNNYTLYTQNLNPSTVNTDYGQYTGGGCGNMLGETDYLTFKYDWKDSANTGILCRNKTKTLNSLYFYFGLNKNKTALSKTLEKYFSPCPRKEDAPFTIIVDATNTETLGGTNGEIVITIIGGTGPYTVTIINPDGTTDEYPLSGDTLTFTGLEAGSYPITVVDSNGLVNTTTVIVGGPVPLNCNIRGFDTTGFDPLTNISLNDGIIEISISDGLMPYYVKIERYLLTNPITNQPVFASPDFDGSIVGNTYTQIGLPIGLYFVSIQDSSATPLECGSAVVINEPEELIVDVNKFNVRCYNECNGYIQISLSGESPYNITLTRNDSANILNNQQFNTTPNTSNVTITGYTNSTLAVNNLCEGSYNLIIIDSTGQSLQEAITILNAPQLGFTLPATVSGNFSGGTGSITINATNMAPSPISGEVYIVQLYDTASGTQPIETQTNVLPITFNNLNCPTDDFYIVYRNGNNCRFPSNPPDKFQISSLGTIPNC